MADAPRRRLLIHPMVRRAATGIAAAVLLAGTGWVVSSELQQEGNPLARLFAASARVKRTPAMNLVWASGLKGSSS